MKSTTTGRGANRTTPPAPPSFVYHVETWAQLALLKPRNQEHSFSTTIPVKRIHSTTELARYHHQVVAGKVNLTNCAAAKEAAKAIRPPFCLCHLIVTSDLMEATITCPALADALNVALGFTGILSL